MKRCKLDREYVVSTLIELLETPSPTGYTDGIVHVVGDKLKKLDVPFELTRRGAIRANIKGKVSSPDRALVAHLDTIGAMVSGLKENGRLVLSPIGRWSSRFAEGGRVTIFTDTTSKRGTVLPLKSSGHVHDLEIDTQEVSWDNIEVRVDETCHSRADLLECGFDVGDFVAFDPRPEIIETGFIVSRHLDGKVGCAILLGLAKAVREHSLVLPLDLHLLFTITEEVGSGASAVLHQDVAEMVTVDMASVAPEQNSSEYGITVVMKDASGPFEWHLTHKLLALCNEFKLPCERDTLKYYYCDSASAIESGSDIRTALVSYGVDGSHGYERVHQESMFAVGDLLILYAQSEPTFARDQDELGPLEGFPVQPD